jgi:hypothetical protein
MRSLTPRLLVVLALFSSTASARKPRPPRAETADAAVAEVEALLQQGRWGDVLKTSAKAVVSHPDHAALRYYRGLVLLTTNQFPENARTRDELKALHSHVASAVRRGIIGGAARPH